LDHVKCNFAQKLPFATILLHFKQFLPNLQCLQWLQTAFRQRIKQLGPCRAPKVGKKKHVLPFYGIFGHFPMFLLCCQADSKLKKHLDNMKLLPLTNIIYFFCPTQNEPNFHHFSLFFNDVLNNKKWFQVWQRLGSKQGTAPPKTSFFPNFHFIETFLSFCQS
jgi:hypothetical protein